MTMADRKQFLGADSADAELVRLLEDSKDVVVTDAVLREQRVSFAFGNAPHSQDVTKDSVRQASHSMRLLA
jgi:hypothetical protein